MLEEYLNSLVNFTPLVGYQLWTSVVGNGRINQPDGLYEAGSVLDLVAIPDEGWIFDGWSGDTTEASSEIGLAMNGNRSVTASFSLQPSSITEVQHADRLNVYCYPNPVNVSAKIAFTLEEPALVNICLYDVFGKQIRQIIHKRLESGLNEVVLDATDIKPGIYLYSVSAGDERILGRITVVNQ